MILSHTEVIMLQYPLLYRLHPQKEQMGLYKTICKALFEHRNKKVLYMNCADRDIFHKEAGLPSVSVRIKRTLPEF